MNDKVFIGIDTSNYKTSFAILSEEGEILADERILLRIPEGKRGLRQQEALFQHVNNLPVVMKKAGLSRHTDILAVSVSSRPRPIDGSYMPVFLAGELAAVSISESHDAPLYRFSHQEGHIEAASYGTGIPVEEELVCFHFSGGTTEAVLRKDGGLQLVGGSRDISYGQLLDRTGVALGMAFPAGEEMDGIALTEKESLSGLPRIRSKEGYVNLSGIESHIMRLLEQGLPEGEQPRLIRALFESIGLSIRDMMKDLRKKTGISRFLFAGGVSSSAFIRKMLLSGEEEQNRIYFGRPELSSDNAVGTALLGRKSYFHETHQCITTE